MIYLPETSRKYPVITTSSGVRRRRFSGKMRVIFIRKTPASYKWAYIAPLIRAVVMSENSTSKLVLLFGVFLFLLNFPLLVIFDREELLWGVPKLFFYLFFVWAVLITLVFGVVRQLRTKRRR